MFKVSQSKMKTWRKCRQAYHYKYVERLRRKFKSRPLQFGTMVHSMIEAHADRKDPMRVLSAIEKSQGKMFRAEREHYGDIIGDVRHIMASYFDFWKKDDIDYRLIDGKRAEHEFEVEIAKGIVATGKIDAVGHQRGLRWLVEHKSFGKRIPDDDARWRDLQSCVYIRIMDILGWKRPDGLLWDYIWSKPPMEPQFLKSGKLARRLIVTLPSKVQQFVSQHNVAEDDASRLMSIARKNLPRYFRRITVPTKPAVIDTVFSDFVTTAKEMKATHGVKPCRSIDQHCTWCDYEPLCRATFRGGDVDFLKEKDYEVAKKDPVAEVQEYQ